MTNPIQDRVRAAISAKTGTVTAQSLRPARPPSEVSVIADQRWPRPHRWSAPLLVAAAVVAVAIGTASVVALGQHSSPAHNPSPSVPIPPATDRATAATTVPPSAAVRTQIKVIRPVTRAGTPAPGYSVSTKSGGPVNCAAGGKPIPSWVAVDGNILDCFPTSENSFACWKAAQPLTAICFFSPSSMRVWLIPAVAAIPSVTASTAPQPIELVLSDGARCDYVENGTLQDLVGRPGWGTTYPCDHNESVFANHGDGIDTSPSEWTVQVAQADGTGTLRTRHVVTAYFVGTA